MDVAKDDISARVAGVAAEDARREQGVGHRDVLKEDVSHGNTRIDGGAVHVQGVKHASWTCQPSTAVVG